MQKTNACSKLVICDTLCRSCHRCNSVCSRFERKHCSQIQKAPYVCNGCCKPRHLRTIQTKYDYNAQAVHRQYEELLVSSREGVNLTKKEVRRLNETVTPLIAQGQSPYMELLVGRLMNRCTQGAVKAEFEKIQKALGSSFEFSFIFPVILTDRGSEFRDPETLQKLQLRYITPDEVTLSPKLLK